MSVMKAFRAVLLAQIAERVPLCKEAAGRLSVSQVDLLAKPWWRRRRKGERRTCWMGRL